MRGTVAKRLRKQAREQTGQWEDYHARPVRDKFGRLSMITELSEHCGKYRYRKLKGEHNA